MVERREEEEYGRWSGCAELNMEAAKAHGGVCCTKCLDVRSANYSIPPASKTSRAHFSTQQVRREHHVPTSLIDYFPTCPTVLFTSTSLGYMQQLQAGKEGTMPLQCLLREQPTTTAVDSHHTLSHSKRIVQSTFDIGSTDV